MEPAPGATAVRDFDGQLLGTLARVERHPRTGAPRWLVVSLDPAAQRALGTAQREWPLPARDVGGLRKGEMVLSRRLGEMARQAQR